MSDLIAEWCDYHHNLNNIGRARRVAQLRVLRDLEQTLAGPVEQLQGRDLERYLAQLVRDGYHAHTVSHHLRMIRPFLRWCWGHGLIDAERWLHIQEVKPPRGAYDGKPRPYSKQQIRRFWIELDERYPWTADPDKHKRTPERGEYWVRRWAAGSSKYKRVYPYARRLQVEAIVSLALYGGLRRKEVYSVSLEDMSYQNEYVRVVSRKGPDAHEKVRAVPMCEPIALACGNWIEFREQVLNPGHDFPWLCLHAGTGGCNAWPTKEMSPTQFNGLLGDIGRGWEFHRLRHTFATERYRAGMPVEVLKEVLGHATLRQTLGYAQIDTDRVLQVARDTDRQFLEALR